MATLSTALIAPHEIYSINDLLEIGSSLLNQSSTTDNARIHAIDQLKGKSRRLSCFLGKLKRVQRASSLKARAFRLALKNLPVHLAKPEHRGLVETATSSSTICRTSSSVVPFVPYPSLAHSERKVLSDRNNNSTPLPIVCLEPIEAEVKDHRDLSECTSKTVSFCLDTSSISPVDLVHNNLSDTVLRTLSNQLVNNATSSSSKFSSIIRADEKFKKFLNDHRSPPNKRVTAGGKIIDDPQPRSFTKLYKTVVRNNFVMSGPPNFLPGGQPTNWMTPFGTQHQPIDLDGGLGPILPLMDNHGYTPYTGPEQSGIIGYGQAAQPMFQTPMRQAVTLREDNEMDPIDSEDLGATKQSTMGPSPINPNAEPFVPKFTVAKRNLEDTDDFVTSSSNKRLVRTVIKTEKKKSDFKDVQLAVMDEMINIDGLMFTQLITEALNESDKARDTVDVSVSSDKACMGLRDLCRAFAWRLRDLDHQMNLSRDIIGRDISKEAMYDEQLVFNMLQKLKEPAAKGSFPYFNATNKNLDSHAIVGRQQTRAVDHDGNAMGTSSSSVSPAAYTVPKSAKEKGKMNAKDIEMNSSSAFPLDAEYAIFYNKYGMAMKEMLVLMFADHVKDLAEVNVRRWGRSVGVMPGTIRGAHNLLKSEYPLELDEIVTSLAKSPKFMVNAKAWYDKYQEEIAESFLKQMGKILAVEWTKMSLAFTAKDGMSNKGSHSRSLSKEAVYGTIAPMHLSSLEPRNNPAPFNLSQAAIATDPEHDIMAANNPENYHAALGLPYPEGRAMEPEHDIMAANNPENYHAALGLPYPEDRATDLDHDIMAANNPENYHAALGLHNAEDREVVSVKEPKIVSQPFHQQTGSTPIPVQQPTVQVAPMGQMGYEHPRVAVERAGSHHRTVVQPVSNRRTHGNQGWSENYPIPQSTRRSSGRKADLPGFPVGQDYLAPAPRNYSEVPVFKTHLERHEMLPPGSRQVSGPIYTPIPQWAPAARPTNPRAASPLPSGLNSVFAAPAPSRPSRRGLYPPGAISGSRLPVNSLPPAMAQSAPSSYPTYQPDPTHRVAFPYANSTEQFTDQYYIQHGFTDQARMQRMDWLRGRNPHPRGV